MEHGQVQQAVGQPLPEEVHYDNMAKRLDRFMKQYHCVDGTDQVILRDWLERAALAPGFLQGLNLQTGREVWASQTDGTIIQALRSYESVNPTIDGLLYHIRQLCIAPQETDRAISQVEQLCQGPNLNVLEYVAQFRVRVNRAYTPEDLQNGKISHRLIKSFINGLFSERTRFATANLRPQDLDNAFHAAIQADTCNEWVRQDVRVEEPMDVSMVRTLKPPPETEGSTLTTVLGQLVERIDRLERERAAVCYYCKKSGHLQRDCLKKKKDSQKRRITAAPARDTNN